MRLGAVVGQVVKLPGKIVAGRNNLPISDAQAAVALPNFGSQTLLRTFTIKEKVKFVFGMQAYNVLNHANFANPSSAEISNPAFGRIFSTVGTPRLIQFSLRYAF